MPLSHPKESLPCSRELSEVESPIWFWESLFLFLPALAAGSIFMWFVYWLVSAWVCVLSCVQLFTTPQTLQFQAPLSMEFSKQEYWSGLPIPIPGYLPYPGIEPESPALAGRFFTNCATWEDQTCLNIWFVPFCVTSSHLTSHCSMRLLGWLAICAISCTVSCQCREFVGMPSVASELSVPPFYLFIFLLKKFFFTPILKMGSSMS